MAKGTAAKNEVTNKILSCFSDAFTFGKEIRIPMMEDGKLIEIKVSLTVARDVISTAAPIDEINLTPFEKEEIKELEDFLDARI